MSIIAVEIPEILFADMPAELRFQKDGILNPQSGYPYLLICFGGGLFVPEIAQTLKLKFGDLTSITFTFEYSPTDDATQLPAYITGSMDTYAQQLASAIYAHPYINQNFYVSSQGYDSISNVFIIQIIARERGVNGNVSVDSSSTVITSGNVTIAETINDVALSDYVLNARAIVTTGNEGLLIPNIVNNLQSAGLIDNDSDRSVITFYDAPGVCKAFMDVDIPHNIWLVLSAKKSFSLLTLEVTETYDTGFNTGTDGYLENDTVYKKTGPSPSGIMCLNGGLSMNAWPVKSFQAWLANSGLQRFLTLQPGRQKLIDIYQPEWLSIILAAGLYKAVFNVTYADGSTAIVNNSFSRGYPGISIIPTGVPQAGISSSQPVVTYTVQLQTSGGSPLSEIFTYIIDTRYFRYVRYFIYKNSFGQIDTLRCVGVNKYSIKRTPSTAGRAVTSNSRMDRGSVEMIYNPREESWLMRTGWLLGLYDKAFLTDFLSSTYVAEVIMPLVPATGDTPAQYFKQPYRSCIVQQDSIDMWQMDDFNWGLEWKMAYANPELNYSNLPAATDTWYDTFIAFTANVTALSSPPGIYFDFSGYAEVWVNGAQQLTGGGTWAIATTGIYYIEVKGARTGSVTIEAQNATVNITVTKIEGPKLEELDLLWFNNFNDDALCQMPQYLPILAYIQIWTYGALSIDKLLTAFNRSFISFGNLAGVDFSYTAPSAAGYKVKAILQAAGVTVLTA